MEVVFDGSPWSFNDDPLVIECCDPDRLPYKYLFDSVEFWIQLHGLPVHYLTPRSIAPIASHIGVVIPILLVDTALWGRYARVRVRVNITRPLRQCISVTLPSSKVCLI
ncbi:protein of unknown function DUF4283 [Macleaya cordata]|uniref:Uncharacterized protein n=1 Tax=Macleaya cordata TaxID=56857 RepID=A0A200QXT9_MACCD|nr:protein of unknown function DUF4283 [Macleaya cordata]